MRAKIFLISIVCSSILFGMGNDNINYDEQFDRVDETYSVEAAETIDESGVEEEQIRLEDEREDRVDEIIDKSQILLDLTLDSFAIENINGKNRRVRYVLKNSPVIYINRLINRSSIEKRGIIVKNPIPKGSEYIKGSATCGSGCKIFYSNDNGETLLGHEEGRVNYIEFYFDTIPPNREVRMGFRAIVKEGG